MIIGNKIIVVLPANNAKKALLMTYHAIPNEIVDEIILVDDQSVDHTTDVAQRLGITTIIHPQNRGYCANQKTFYQVALAHRADIIMLHPISSTTRA